MNILALDLGTKTGFCGPNGMGTWKLSTAKEVTEWSKTRLTRRCDPRIIRLYSHLAPLSDKLDLVVFEDVQFSSSTFQCQLWSSLRAAVWLSFSQRAVKIECVPVATLKKFATGHGGATKEMMRDSAGKMCPEFAKHGAVYDDNAVDAFWLYHWAHTNLGRLPT